MLGRPKRQVRQGMSIVCRCGSANVRIMVRENVSFFGREDETVEALCMNCGYGEYVRAYVDRPMYRHGYREYYDEPEVIVVEDNDFDEDDTDFDDDDGDGFFGDDD